MTKGAPDCAYVNCVPDMTRRAVLEVDVERQEELINRASASQRMKKRMGF